MNSFDSTVELENVKIVKVSPMYNNKNAIEFCIQPEPKGCLVFSDILVHVTYKIDAKYIVDQQALDKLFDSVEVQINKTPITSRSTTGEYYYSSFFVTKLSYNTENVASGMKNQGWFSNKNLNSVTFLNMKFLLIIHPYLVFQ